MVTSISQPPKSTEDGVAGSRLSLRYQAGAIFYEALKEAGIDFIVYLPDNTLYPVVKLAEEDPGMMAICSAREDEGMAIAVGAYYAGAKPALVVEGAGVAWCPWMIADCVNKRTPMLIIASHGTALGEAYDYGTVARLTTIPILAGLGVPYTAINRIEDVPMVVKQSQRTVNGQKTPVAIVVSPHVMGM